MEIIVIGSETQAAELVAKFGASHNYHKAGNAADARKFFDMERIVFDFTPGMGAFDRAVFSNSPLMSVFLDTTLNSLSSLEVSQEANSFYGFCGLPTFVNRPLMEVSLSDDKSLSKLKLVFERLGSEFVLVADKVGLVTPRVICMIINEAYYAVQDGTATREDIDMAMKLGTNYPWGPFEWSRRIGLDNIKAVLRAVYRDSQDERYRICPLLEREK
jgi:3-hydroxybutyryl-CoA dehydrogenase